MIVRSMIAVFAFATSDGLPVKSPKAVGMSPERLQAIDRVVQRGVTAGGYPGASVVVGRRGAAVWQKGFGRLGWTPSSAAVTADRTIYDLASLTKVVGTTTAAMVLWDEGRLDLDAPVSRYLPTFAGGAKDAVTVRHLLTHRSGLPAGRELWRLANSPNEARNVVMQTPLACRPGDCFIYSDLGADILGWVVETVAGQGLDVLLDERVFKPLGMNDTQFRPADSLAYRIAPTEVTPPRGYPLRGQVHDENAYTLGGVAGHAGLFSTAADLSVFAQMMLNGGTYDGVRILSDSAVELFTTRAAGTRALGWDTADGDGGSGEYLSARSYGHTGYTGTSIWVDPDREMFVILLTNRVHAARARRPAKVISDVRADLADAAALAVTDDPTRLLAMPAAFRADRAIGWNQAPRSSRSARHRRANVRRKTTARKATAKKPTAKKSSAKKPSAKPKASASSSRSKAKVSARPTRSTSKSSASARKSVKPVSSSSASRASSKAIAGKRTTSGKKT